MKDGGEGLVGRYAMFCGGDEPTEANPPKRPTVGHVYVMLEAAGMSVCDHIPW